MIATLRTFLAISLFDAAVIGGIVAVVDKRAALLVGGAVFCGTFCTLAFFYSAYQHNR